MVNLGDRAVGTTICLDFNTHKADGTPITLAGTPAISVYKNSTTESTSGVTLTVDYDSRTGMHHVVIDTSSSGSFYATDNDFSVVITTGTVDSISVVGTVVGRFSLGRANISHITSTAQTARDIGASVLLSSGSGTGQLDFTSGVVKANLTQIDGAANGTHATGMVPADARDILGTAISSPATAGVLDVNIKNIANAVVNTANAQIGVNVVSQANIDFGALQKASLNAATPASVTGAVGSIATNGITSSSIATDAINAASIKADAVTKIQNGLATPTNITAGTITTVTNLTNAPTNGDLTTTMKTSVTTAATAATPIAASVSGNVSGNVTGSIGSLAAQAQTDVKSALTSQGYTTTRAGYLDTLSGLVAAIWANATRTLSSFGTLVADVWSATTRTLTSVSGLTSDANIVSIDGQATNGNYATLNLKKLNIVNSTGDAIVATSSGNDGIALKLTGNGAGEAIKIQGGTSASALWAKGGLSAATGSIEIQGNSVGAIRAVATVAGTHGIFTSGYGVGAGLRITGGGTGNAVEIYSAAGDGINVLATGGNGINLSTYSNGINVLATGNGFNIVGNGSGISVNGTDHALDLIGGSHCIAIGTDSGDGISINAGGRGVYISSSNHGIDIGTGANGINIASDAKGINVDGATYGAYINGTASHGIYSTGAIGFGIHGTSGDGLQSIGGTNGAGAEFTGAGSGPGVTIRGGTSGSGMIVSGRGSSDGFVIQAESGANGLSIYGNAAGHGVYAVGGATSGHGIYAVGNGTNGSGMQLKRGGSGGHDLTFETPDCTIPTVTTLTNKTGFSLASSQSFSTTGSVGSVTGSVDSVTDPVTVGTITDKTGYALTIDYDAAKTAAQASDLATVSGKCDTIYTTEGEIIGDILDMQNSVTSITDVLPISGKISNFSLDDAVDGGVTVKETLTATLAMTSGRFKKDYPVSGKVTFYKRNDTDTAFIMTITDSERTRS